MQENNVISLLKVKFPELSKYLELIASRKEQGLIRESYLYMRLAEEYIIEILARVNNLQIYEYNNEINGNAIRSVYSLSEELFNLGILKYDEKMAHDNVRRFSNAALHHGISEIVLEKNWTRCYNSMIYISSFLTTVVEYEQKEKVAKENDLMIYSEGDFLADVELEFGQDMDDDIKEANSIILERINFSSLDYNKAKSITNYYINSIKDGATLPILAARYAIKMSKE